MLDDMVGRTVSPVFVGREAELGVLTEAFDEARKGAASVVLLGGEAGVGKTRLVGRFTEHAIDEGAHVLSGGCVELSAEGLAYAPFTAALRQLVREMGAAPVSALLPDGAGRDLARLLPEFGEPSGDTETETARARLFEQILALLERLAERRPIVLTIEDVHWADRSSRDLIAFLSRNLGTAPVLMILTFRSDELHRQHPLRPVLAELGRVEGVLRMEIPRLTHDEVAAQMAGILGGPAEYHTVLSVFQRSEGIPLFVEALVEAGGDSSLPESLHDLITGSVENLPDETQRVLRMAAAGGTRIGHALLAAVSGLADAELEDAIRPAVAANVIQVADGRAYVFRHALIREAVHDELLPGEHTRMHARFAEEIERHRTLVPPGRAAIEIAHHWYSARDDSRALNSAWLAARKAAHAFAYTEQMQLLERVLTLWDKVPDAAERIGADHTHVLELASGAALSSGEHERGMKFVKAALSELDEQAEPERVSELIVLLAQIQKERRKPGALENLRRAERLVPDPGAARAAVLTKLGSYLLFSGAIAEGTALTSEALRIARSVGDESLVADLLMNMAIGHSIDGRLEETIATNNRAMAIGRRLGHGRLILRAMGNNIDAMNNLGRSEEAVALAVEAERLARKYGRYRVQGLFMTLNRAEALDSLGRWDEAIEVIESALTRDPVLQTRHHLLRARGDIAAARGEADVLESVLAELDAFTGPIDDAAQETTGNTRLLMAYHRLRGEPGKALDSAERILRDDRLSSKALMGWRLLADICTVCDSYTHEAFDESQSERARVVRALADGIRAGMHVDGPVGDAYRMMCERAHDEAAAAWARLGRCYPQARALVMAAKEASVAGDREAAAVRLRDAHPLAVSLGAHPLIESIEVLSRRVGVSLDGGAPLADTTGADLLTPREVEVLRLVAQGRSNRDIAAELFISAKTVSVHVSNILAKLGVSSRTEATAAAHRRSLLT
ncbi:helix-turn-helix transcriptional regulator [Spongiactinospora sp. TRM90649]|uniref:ATP-binding protein n=1 Tax=Spongiactinospora sp. TRM90649 TaxID=3031114 RepID=UPI0023F767DD|nr:helix-turn-helix transcriptional regulator [Spongiactinospora sp. TRM90649]MDF5751907.1 AAA family ATPase [Spongiactinospora sp. TRM90649]